MCGARGVQLDVDIGSTQVPVTSNLDAALKRPELYDRLRKSWVDVVCIKQDDLVESSNKPS